MVLAVQINRLMPCNKTRSQRRHARLNQECKTLHKRGLIMAVTLQHCSYMYMYDRASGTEVFIGLQLLFG